MISRCNPFSFKRQRCIESESLPATGEGHPIASEHGNLVRVQCFSQQLDPGEGMRSEPARRHDRGDGRAPRGHHKPEVGFLAIPLIRLHPGSAGSVRARHGEAAERPGPGHGVEFFLDQPRMAAGARAIILAR